MERKHLFRLCHVCKKINEGENEILKCDHCGKGFLPLNYFDKLRAKAQGYNIKEEEYTLSLFNPINGLVVFW